MEIFEDKNEYSGNDREINEKKEPEQEKVQETKKPDSGMRIIYQAPENGAKREYVGFTPQERKFERKPVETVEDIEIEDVPKVEYKGGHAFEDELKRQNRYPERRKAPEKTPKPDEKEIIKKRYEEYKFREQMRKELPTEKNIELKDFGSADEYYDVLDVEEVNVDSAKKKPKAPLTGGEIARRIILAVAAVAIVVSLAVLGNQYWQYKKNKDMEAGFSNLIITEAPTTKKDDKKDDKDKDKEPETTTKPLTVEEQWAQLRKDYPNVQFPTGISLKYAKFYAINQDFVGYLDIKALGIGLPVLQSKTENYYLRRNIYKQKSKYGCPFVPTDNDMVNLDRNTVVYGHNMSDGSIFAPINKYKSLDGFKKAPVIQFDTVYGSYKWKVVAAFISNAEPDQDNGYVFPYNFTKLENDTSFMNYVKCLKERSLYDTGVDIVATDKILTLSTCDYDFEEGRFVVVARLIRPGESEAVDTSLAKANEKPHYPQAYYDKKKKKNPYKDAEKWHYYGNVSKAQG